MRMEIRRLQPDDWALYRDVRLAALRDAPFAFGSTVEGESAYAEPVWRERLRSRALFVALDAGCAVGLAAGVRDRERPDEALLISMWTAPAVRGQGIGETLVQSVLAWTAAEGISRISLEVTDGNDAAERLYRRCGFERTGQVDRSEPDKPTFEMARHVL